MAAAPDVSVVIPSHAAASTVAGMLEGLAKQTLAPDRFEVLVVDTGADGTARVLEGLAADWQGADLRVVRAPLHGGPAVKRNLGAEAARGRLLAFVDADCRPEARWLEAGLAAYERGFQLVQGRTAPPDGEIRPLFFHGVHIERDVGLHETCNIFYDRELFHRLGGFDGRYFRRLGEPFGEDVELGWRARRSGARYVFEKSAVVRHPIRPETLAGHLRSQWLGRAFPALARDFPELRDSLFYRRVFLTRRTAAVTVAVAGASLARRFPPAGLLALPYLLRLSRDVPPGSRGVTSHAAAIGTRALSDLTLFAALAWGSARSRTLVL